MISRTEELTARAPPVPDPPRSFDAFFESLERRSATAPAGRAATLHELVRRSDARALLAIALDWAIVVAAVAASERIGGWPCYLAAVLVVATRINAFYLEWLHEALHGNLFTRKRWHEKLDFLYGVPVFSSVALARPQHLKHHRDYVEESVAPNYSYDYWDIDPASCRDRRRLFWIWWIRPFTGWHTWVFVRDTTADLVTDRPFLARCAVFWSVVAAAFAAAGALPLVFWYWLVPLLVLHPPFYFWQDMAQHWNVKKSPTRDVRGLVYRLVLNPHGRGAYHNLHHLQPGVPWFNLERASRLLIDDDAIDIASGFFELSRQSLEV